MIRRINKILKLGLLLFILLPGILLAQTYTPGNSYFGESNYIEYFAGNLPLIITVPHGGSLLPSSIPDRTCGETVKDSYTEELAKEIKDAVFATTGKYPHIIFNHLGRIKLDANRALNEATCGNAIATISWNEFHAFIESAKITIMNDYGKGLYIDLHGHGHAVQQLEIGYLLTTTELSVSDVTLNLTTTKNKTSIKNLANSNVNGLTHSDLIRGDFSLGAMMENAGYQSVPSKINRYPVSAYFSGGYNTERHGSKSSGTIDGIQIECNQDVRFTTSARQTFAIKASEVFLGFITKHYFPNLTSVDSDPLNEILIYPNPAVNYIIVKTQQPVQLHIYDLMGRTLISKSIQNEEIVNISQLSVGIYLLTFDIKGVIIYREKVIKSKY